MATKEYKLTRKIYGKAVMQPGEVVKLTDDEARSDFWRTRIDGEPTPAKTEVAEKPTKAEVIERLKAAGVKYNANSSVEELAALLK